MAERQHGGAGQNRRRGVARKVRADSVAAPGTGGSCGAPRCVARGAVFSDLIDGQVQVYFLLWRWCRRSSGARFTVIFNGTTMLSNSASSASEKEFRIPFVF
jgi:hypothetical protein